MKKLTAILFLTVYLLYTAGVNEIFKVAVLIDHFHETQKNDRNISFARFLLMHYVTDDNNDNDNDRDSQLPFKSSDSHTSATNFFYVAAVNTQPLTARTFTLCKPVKTITRNLFIETDFNSTIWHPPRFS